jgi:alpha-L-fucosidase 2
MQWRYDVPATKYWEGLSIGTGRFSAMIPGALGHEVIAFDETLWTSDPYNPNNPEEQEVFKKVRDLINRWKSVIDENLIEFNAKAGEKYVIK